MVIFRIPTITKEELKGITKRVAESQHDHVGKVKAATKEVHMLVVDKLRLDSDTRQNLITLDEHKQRLFTAQVSLIAPPVFEARLVFSTSLAKSILYVHRDLSPPDANEVDALLKRMDSGEKPNEVVHYIFLSKCQAVCEDKTKRTIGDDNYIIYTELHRQIKSIVSEVSTEFASEFMRKFLEATARLIIKEMKEDQE